MKLLFKTIIYYLSMIASFFLIFFPYPFWTEEGLGKYGYPNWNKLFPVYGNKISLFVFIMLTVPLPIIALLKQKNKADRCQTIIFLSVIGILYCFLGQLIVPRVSSDHYHSKTYSAKKKLYNLKSALIAFNTDLGRYPFSGVDSKKWSSYKISTETGMGLTKETNCLYKKELKNFKYLGMRPEDYKRRWKGPYLDDLPKELMLDAWGKKIQYFVYKNSLYIRSAGKDGKFDSMEKVLSYDYKYSENGDDLYETIARFKKTKKAGINNEGKK